MKKIPSILSIVIVASFWIGCDTAENTEDPNKTSYIRLIGRDMKQQGVDVAVLH